MIMAFGDPTNWGIENKSIFNVLALDKVEGNLY